MKKRTQKIKFLLSKFIFSLFLQLFQVLSTFMKIPGHMTADNLMSSLIPAAIWSPGINKHINNDNNRLFFCNIKFLVDI